MIVVVVGAHRTGTSCMGGILSRLGVHMGDRLIGCEPSGGYEDFGLAELCEQAMPFPSVNMRMEPTEFRRRFQAYVRKRLLDQRIVGMKYPHLCALGPYVAETLGNDFRCIVMERELRFSVASLVRRSELLGGSVHITAPQAWRLQQWLEHSKLFYQQRVRHLNVCFSEMIANPSKTVASLSSFLNIECEPQRYVRAVKHVRQRSLR